MSILRNGAIGKPVKPELILDYRAGTYMALNGSNILVPTTFDNTHIFSRVGGGGRFKENGLYEYQSSGIRFDHDPVTLSRLGILIENQATNLYLNSGLLSASVGTIVVTNSLETTSPSGLYVAEKFTDQATTGEHYTFDKTSPLTAGVTYSFSVFMKRLSTGALRQLYLRIATGGNTFGIRFNPSSKTFASISGGATGTYQDVGDGWMRVAMQFTAAATATSVIRIQFLNETGLSTYLGDTSSGMYLWGAQFTIQPRTSYIPTEGSSVTRSADYAEITSTGIKTIILDHDIASGLPLLATGSNDLLTSNGAGRSILAMDASNIYISHNGSAYVTASKPAFDSTIKLLRDAANTRWANGHLAKLIAFPRKLSVDEAMAA